MQVCCSSGLSPGARSYDGVGSGQMGTRDAEGRAREEPSKQLQLYPISNRQSICLRLLSQVLGDQAGDQPVPLLVRVPVNFKEKRGRASRLGPKARCEVEHGYFSVPKRLSEDLDKGRRGFVLHR